MADILLKSPNSPYQSLINTGAMNVEILNSFIGVTFKTNDGQTVSVSMRDNGFELTYSPDSKAPKVIDITLDAKGLFYVWRTNDPID